MLGTDDLANVNGPNLLLAANSTGARPDSNSGRQRRARRPELSRGTTAGISDIMDGNLRSAGATARDGHRAEERREVQTAGGDLRVTGAAPSRRARISSDGDTEAPGRLPRADRVHVEDQGDGNSRATSAMDGHDIELSDPVDRRGSDTAADSISDRHGALSISSPIVKKDTGGVRPAGNHGG